MSYSVCYFQFFQSIFTASEMPYIINGHWLSFRAEADISDYTFKNYDIEMNEQKTMSNDLLWHYTTPEGLTGIITSNCLWATDVFYLNDSSEFMHGVDIARNIIKDKISSFSGDKKERLESFNTHLSFIGPDHKRPVYVCSLSKAENELSQWKAYCRNGGFSIGFPHDGIGKIPFREL